jgi:hypothetical protein
MNEQTAVLLFREGNQVCALYGQDLHDGTVGVGKTSAEALRNLATQMEEEGIVDEIDSSL